MLIRTYSLIAFDRPKQKAAPMTDVTGAALFPEIGR
jgi:hypothetical protein